MSRCFIYLGLCALWTVMHCDNVQDSYISLSKLVVLVAPSRIYEIYDGFRLQIYLDQSMIFMANQSEYDDYYSNIYFHDINDARVPSCMQSDDHEITLKFNLTQVGIDGEPQQLSFAEMDLSQITSSLNAPLGLRMYDSSDIRENWGWIFISAQNHCFDNVDPVHGAAVFYPHTTSKPATSLSLSTISSPAPISLQNTTIFPLQEPTEISHTKQATTNLFTSTIMETITETASDIIQTTHFAHGTISTVTTQQDVVQTAAIHDDRIQTSYLEIDSTTIVSTDNNVQIDEIQPLTTTAEVRYNDIAQSTDTETVSMSSTKLDYIQPITTKVETDHVDSRQLSTNWNDITTEMPNMESTESFHIGLETTMRTQQHSNTYVIDIGKELNDLKDKLVIDGVDEETSTNTVQNSTNIISISKHVLHDNITNETIDALLDVCSSFMEIPQTFWAVDYLENAHPSNIDCVFIEAYKDHRNTSENDTNPDEISLFVVDGATNLSVDIIPNTDIVDTQNNCMPIEVTLNWNQNGEFDGSYVPQCTYNLPLSMQHTENNYECFVMDYDETKVKCGCTQFGTYSAQAIQQTMDGFAVNYVTVTWLVFLWVVLIFSCCVINTKWSQFDDGPLVSKEVYMAQRDRFRIWLLTKEGETHRILKYEKQSKMIKLCAHLMKNDGLILPFCRRNKGSNYYPMQRILNLLWLILIMTLTTAYIINQNNDALCLFGENPLQWHCINTVFILFVSMLLYIFLYMAHKYCFERTRPQKLEMDLTLFAFREFERLFGASSKYEDVDNEYDPSMDGCGLISAIFHENNGRMKDIHQYNAYLDEIYKYPISMINDDDTMSETEEYIKSSEHSDDEELCYNAHESKQRFSEEWTETDDDTLHPTKSKISPFFRIVSDSITSLISPKKPRFERSRSDVNSFGYLKNIFFDHKHKTSDNSQLEEVTQQTEYTVDATYSVADDSSTDSSDAQIQPTKCGMNAPLPMMHNNHTNTMTDDQDTDSTDDMNEDLLLNTASDLMTDACDDSHLSVAVRNTSSEIYYELQERKEAMLGHYFIHYTTKYVLIWYLIVSMIVFSVLLTLKGAQFNDATFHNTSTSSNELAVAQARSVLPETCTFNFSLLVNNNKQRDDNEWGFISNQVNRIYLYTDTEKWIGLSVLSLVLCWLLYWVLLFLKSYLLICRFDYFVEHGYDPLFCGRWISKKYFYPHSPYLTSVFDQDSGYYVDGDDVEVRTPPLTKNCDFMLQQSIDDESDDGMQSVTEAAENIVEEEEDHEEKQPMDDNEANLKKSHESVKRLSPIQEKDDKDKVNHYLDETLIIFDEDGQLLNPQQSFIVLNNVSDHDDIENAHEPNQ